MSTIAFDASSTGPGSASPLTWNHTFSGSNRLGFITVFCVNGDVLTAITVNGVSILANLIAKKTAVTETHYLFYIIAPPAGSQAISVTTSAGNLAGAAVSYTGCKQTGVPDSSASATQAAGPSTLATSTTIVLNGSWAVTCALNGTAVPTAGTNITNRNSASRVTIGDSNTSESPGSFTQTWNVNTGAASSAIQASFAPVTPPPVTSGDMFSVF